MLCIGLGCIKNDKEKKNCFILLVAEYGEVGVLVNLIIENNGQIG